jgi:hypothetical protein
MFPNHVPVNFNVFIPGVDLKGTIVITRYGGPFRGLKVSPISVHCW